MGRMFLMMTSHHTSYNIRVKLGQKIIQLEVVTLNTLPNKCSYFIIVQDGQSSRVKLVLYYFDQLISSGHLFESRRILSGSSLVENYSSEIS